MKKIVSALLTTMMLMSMFVISTHAAAGDIKLADVTFTGADGAPITALPENAAQVTVSATVNYENYYNPKHQSGAVIDANAQGNIALYAAHYDAGNKLVGVTLLADKIFGGNNTFQTPLDVTNSEKIAVLLWEGNESLKPLASIKKLDGTQNGNKILNFPYYENAPGAEKKYAVINHIDNIIWIETSNEGPIKLHGRPNAEADFAIDAGAAFTQPDYLQWGSDAVRVDNGMTCSVTAANGDVRTYTIYLDKPLTQAKMGSNCNSADTDKTGLPVRSGLYWDNNGFANTGKIVTEGERTYWELNDENTSRSIELGMTDSVGELRKNNKFYKAEYHLTARISDMKNNSWNRINIGMGGLNAKNAPVVKLALSNEGDIAAASDGNAIGEGQAKYSLRYYHHNNTKGVHVKTLNVGEWVDIKAVIRQGMAKGAPKVEIYVNDEVVYSTPYGYMDIDASGVAGFPASGLAKIDNYSYGSNSPGSLHIISDGVNKYCLNIDEIWVVGSDVIPAS